MTHCTIPPEGWRCTRTPGHDGPCAAVKTPTTGMGRRPVPADLLDCAKMLTVMAEMLDEPALASPPTVADGREGWEIS